jgi:dihydroneopterin aldolase
MDRVGKRRDVNYSDVLTLTGVRAFGYHGVFDHERTNGQEFVVDVVAHLAARSDSDDLETTVNYGELAEAIVAAVERDPVNLIETLAERVATVVLGHELISLAQVTVHKPSAPISVPFGDVAVTITRARL